MRTLAALDNGLVEVSLIGDAVIRELVLSGIFFMRKGNLKLV